MLIKIIRTKNSKHKNTKKKPTKNSGAKKSKSKSAQNKATLSHEQNLSIHRYSTQKQIKNLNKL